MIKIVCDRCGREIPNSMAGRISWAFAGDYAGDVFKNSHFCPGCMKEIKIFIQTPVAQAETGLDKAAAGRAAAGKEPQIWIDEVWNGPGKDIDTGKVMTLRNAGWTIKAIADDMSLTVRQVSEALCQHRNNMDGQKDP